MCAFLEIWSEVIKGEYMVRAIKGHKIRIKTMNQMDVFTCKECVMVGRATLYNKIKQSTRQRIEAFDLQ